jgi:hypothetical protein
VRPQASRAKTAGRIARRAEIETPAKIGNHFGIAVPKLRQNREIFLVHGSSDRASQLGAKVASQLTPDTRLEEQKEYTLAALYSNG